MGRVHVLAVLKMVRADLVRVVQLLCRFRAKITSPSVYDPFLGPVKGRCWSKNCFAHFSIHSFHFTFIMISMKKYGEKNKTIFSPRFVSMEMAAIFDFRALTKVHKTLNGFFKCSEKLHTHRRHTDEETYRSVFDFYCIIHF